MMTTIVALAALAALAAPAAQARMLTATCSRTDDETVGVERLTIYGTRPDVKANIRKHKTILCNVATAAANQVSPHPPVAFTFQVPTAGWWRGVRDGREVLVVAYKGPAIGLGATWFS
jgi:hypothetical protein